METIIGVVVVSIAGYVLYKMFTKKETVQEAVAEVKAEAKAEVAKVEEVVVAEVKAEVAKVEEVVVAEVKKAATKAKAAAKKAADVNGDGKIDIADVKAVVKKGGRPKKSV